MFKVAELLKVVKGKLTFGSSDIQAKGISIDSRTIKPGECFIAIKGDNFDGHDFIEQAIKKGASCVIVKSPSHQVTKSQSLAIIEVKDTTKALGDIARFWRNKFNIPVIAVTGSNGKTTTKEMIAWVLSAKFKVLKNEGTKNNHIGLPMALLNLKPEHNVAVLEIGTNHFGEVDNLARICRPNIGVITNIGPTHLEYLHNLEGVLREKYTLLNDLVAPRIGILNADDSLLKKKMSLRQRGIFTVGFGIKNPADFSASCIRRLQTKVNFSLDDKYKFTLSTPGYYNIYNALASIAIARIFGIQHKNIARRLKAFKFPYGRLNILTVRKVRFIDDTYNANPASLGQALDALANFKVKGRRIFVMGDMRELGVSKKKFHLEAGKRIAKACDCLIAVGELSKLSAQAAMDCGLNTNNIFNCKDSAQARRILFDRLSPGLGDVILVKGSRAMKMEEVLKT